MQSKSGKIVRTSQTYCRSCSHHVHHDHHDHQVHNHHCHLVSSPLCTLSSPRSFAASNNNIGLSRHLFSYQTFSFFHVSHLCSPFRLLGHTLVNLLKGSRMLHFPSHPLNFHSRHSFCPRSAIYLHVRSLTGIRPHKLSNFSLEILVLCTILVLS